jgi:peptidoglycan/xylan/chitin deacetylase (PgdA/CDA1 family)
MTILCYHSVDDAWESPLAMPVADFDAQCAWLATHRRVLHLDAALAGVDRMGRPARGVAALTFDDGFAEVYEHALPVLERHGLPATVFIVAETLTAAGRPVDWVRTAPPWPQRTLTVDQILEMQDRGVRFGSHSYRHALLTGLGDTECEQDLRRSREVLEDVLKTSVPFLAYPEGFHDAHVRAAAERAGYTHALALPDYPEPPGPYAIPRVGIYRGNGLAAFRAKMTGSYLPVRVRVYPAVQRLRRSA